MKNRYRGRDEIGKHSRLKICRSKTLRVQVPPSAPLYKIFSYFSLIKNSKKSFFKSSYVKNYSIIKWHSNF